MTELVGSLVNPWYMDWAADDHSALYLVEREPGNRLHRVDLTTSPATLQALAALPAEPWSVVRSTNPDVLYTGSQTVLSKVSLSGGAGGPIITRLGFVPSTEIDPLTGQATTDPAYFFYVKNASFGGSIHVMLNFPGMLGAGASYYKVTMDASPDIATWTNYKWNGVTFVLQNVGPSAGFYKIPTAGRGLGDSRPGLRPRLHQVHATPSTSCASSSTTAPSTRSASKAVSTCWWTTTLR